MQEVEVVEHQAQLLQQEQVEQVGVVLVVGILLQVYGVKLLVDGGSGLARRFGVPPLVIGSAV